MSLFGNRQTLPPGSGLSPEFYSECTPDYCVESDTAAETWISTTENLIAKVETQADQWMLALSQGRSVAGETLQALADDRQASMVAEGMNYSDRRSSAAVNTKSATLDMYSMRETARDDVQRFVTEATKGKALKDVIAQPGTLSMARTVVHLERILNRQVANNLDDAQKHDAIGIVAIGSRYEINPYHKAFLQEAMTKIHLGLLVWGDPGAAYTMLDPANLPGLPESMKRTIATDVLSGEDSVILAFMQEVHEGSTDFFEYLVQNEISPTVKEIVTGMSLGARALQGCRCPLNAAGLCRDAALAIEDKGLPQIITDDMERKREQAKGSIVTQLKAFAQQNKLNPWWSLYTDIGSVSNGSARQASRKRSRGSAQQVNPKSFEASLQPPISREIQPPKVVYLSQKGVDHHVEVRQDDSKQQQTAIQEVLNSKSFSDFMAKYSHDRMLRPFLEAAVSRIMFAPTYRDEPGIVKYRHRSNVPWHTSTGERLLRWRVSGKDFPGFSGNAVKQTRIDFAVSNTSNGRQLEIIDISYKADRDKKSRRGLVARR